MKKLSLRGMTGVCGLGDSPWWRVWNATIPSQLNSFAYLAVNFAGNVAHKLFRVSKRQLVCYITDTSKGCIPLILLQKLDLFRRMFTLTNMQCMKISECRPTQEVLLALNME